MDNKRLENLNFEDYRPKYNCVKYELFNENKNEICGYPTEYSDDDDVLTDEDQEETAG